MMQTSSTEISAWHTAQSIGFLCMSPGPQARGGGERAPNALDDLHDCPSFAACHTDRRSPLDGFHIPKSAEQFPSRQGDSATFSLHTFCPCHRGFRAGNSAAKFGAGAEPAPARGAGETFSCAARAGSRWNNRRAGPRTVGCSESLAAECPKFRQRTLATARAYRCDLVELWINHWPHFVDCL